MADSQDIFILLLIILFMANSEDNSGSGLTSINSVILMLLLFGTLRDSGNGCPTPRTSSRCCCNSQTL